MKYGLMKVPPLKSLLIHLLVLTTVVSCKPTTSDPNVEMVISELTERFPQLPRGRSNQSDFYKLNRTVIYGKNEFQLQLYSTPDSIENPQQIIVLINSKGEPYAIPLFSNKYRDYWNFEFEKPIEGIKRTNTTFEKEFTKAITVLNLNDSTGIGAKVLNEMLISLLNCQVVRETDERVFMSLDLTPFHDEPNDDWDSCFVRQKKSFDAIKKSIHPSEYHYNYNAYLDTKNLRVYQIVNQGKNRGKKLKPEIKTYRLNCNTHPLMI